VLSSHSAVQPVLDGKAERGVVFGGGITDAYHDSYCYHMPTASLAGWPRADDVPRRNTVYNSVNFTASYRG